MIKILNKIAYKELLEKFSDYHFIQSAEHDYQEIMYGNCHYIGFFDKNEPIILFKYATTRVMKSSFIALGSFGPIINIEKVDKEQFHKFIEDLRELLKKQNIIFLQIYPVLLNNKNDEIAKLLKGESKLRISYTDGSKRITSWTRYFIPFVISKI